MSQDRSTQQDAPGILASGDLVKRHAWPLRTWHWLNALTIFILLMSGMMIFNAHPRLYWGEYGANPDHAWLEIGAMDGLAFPGWMTLPSFYSLADARLWHLAFALVLAFALLLFLLWGLISGHLRRTIHITAKEWRPAVIWHDVAEHLRLRFPKGAAAMHYGVLQKLSYVGVLFVLLPLLIFTGLAMSPGFDAVSSISDLLGGRQSARSLHFIAAAGIALFIAVHLIMVLLSGPINQLRGMITGRFRLP